MRGDTMDFASLTRITLWLRATGVLLCTLVYFVHPGTRVHTFTQPGTL